MKKCPYCLHEGMQDQFVELHETTWYICVSCHCHVLLPRFETRGLLGKKIVYNVDNADFCKEFGLSLPEEEYDYEYV